MLLGIDYGLKNIGLALSEGEIAQPLKTIVVSSQGSVTKKLQEITKKYQIDKIIIGISEGKSKNRSLAFGKRIANMLQLPIEFVDETLTTVEANSLRTKSKTREHARAAAIILQRYLDNV